MTLVRLAARACCLPAAALAVVAFAARAHAQGYMGDIVPLHSFADIPPLPKSVAEVVSRSDARQQDKEAAPLRQRIDGWGKSMAASVQASVPRDYAAYMGAAGRGGTMSPAAGGAIATLLQAAGRMTADFTQNTQEFSLRTLPPLEDAYRAKVKAASNKYQDCLHHGSTRSCHGVYESSRSAALAAGDDFLRAVAGPFSTLETHMNQVAGQGEAAITQASRSFGANPPPMARIQIQGIRQQELNALLGVLNAEQSIFEKVDRNPLVEMASPDAG